MLLRSYLSLPASHWKWCRHPCTLLACCSQLAGLPARSPLPTWHLCMWPVMVAPLAARHQSHCCMQALSFNADGVVVFDGGNYSAGPEFIGGAGAPVAGFGPAARATGQGPGRICMCMHMRTYQLCFTAHRWALACGCQEGRGACCVLAIGNKRRELWWCSRAAYPLALSASVAMPYD